eukprot:TRINITY_DN9962_c0_g1_i1.p2 TRINITY_DN9962_c0_g1~~TRINITY_DN9962_c0_g1_i1.p2  ORF type:complete len:438 (+),score=158.41 TRINITY_DN9962_c0_g1_i1:57-1316(+)
MAEAGLLERARRVLPNGMYGHMSVSRLPAGYPQFFTDARGGVLIGADGKEYVDLMCGYGCNILGYNDRQVEAAAEEQRRRVDTATGPTPRLVELSERLVSLVPGADWCVLGKNGTDATTYALTVARAATRRKSVLVQAGAYHGGAPVWLPGRPGVIPSDHAHQHPYAFNDLASVERAADGVGADLAAVVVSAVCCVYNRDLLEATQEFAEGVRRLCDRTGAMLIVDDVRAGFHIDVRGTWARYGVCADLTAFSKALGNGHAVSALVGGRRARVGAERSFATGSFWGAGVSHAAALEVLRQLTETDALGRVRRAGETLRAGLRRQASKHGFEVVHSGPVQLPFMTFVEDTKHHGHKPVPTRPRAEAWCREAVRRGVYLHPYHNWFVCAAHTDEDMRKVLAATDEAFAAVRREFGPTPARL